ncbi:MAG: MBG domain-containing protein [Halomonadaceae bacterium]|jgi:filamentous hemagglutinin family protein
MKRSALNHTYRLVWNHLRQSFVPVSEASVSRGKQNRGGLSVGAAVGGAFMLAVVQPAYATLPSGGTLVGGEGSITTNGSNMTVTQMSDRMAINWNSFSVGSGNRVAFDQPGANAVALNRVLGSSVSVIQGAIDANGHVFLVNPNGVTFTNTAQVNVGGLVASTLDISTSDFISGNYTFSGNSAATVSNAGKIIAGEGGTIALIAARVENLSGGRLETNGGDVLLAAGSRVRLDLGGPVALEVQASALNALIAQGGAIKADGGRVLLTARAAGDLAATVINHTGVIEAQSLSTNEHGEIALLGSGGGVTVAGTLDASGAGLQQGGAIHVSSSGSHGQVSLNGATLASGEVTVSGTSRSTTGVSLMNSIVTVQGEGNVALSGTHNDANTSGNGLTVANSTIRTESGNLSLYGATSHAPSTGVSIDASSRILANAGEIRIEGRNTGHLANSALALNGQVGAAVGSGVESSTANITLAANKLTVGNQARLDSQGELTLTRATAGGMAIGNYHSDSYLNVSASLLQEEQLGNFSKVTLGGATVSTFRVAENVTFQHDVDVLTTGRLEVAADVRTANDLGLGHGVTSMAGQDYQVFQGKSVSLTDPGNQSFRLGAWNDLTNHEYTLVSSANQLQGLASGDLSGRYALAGDIDLSGIANFTAIGSEDAAFQGTLAGLGHTITGLKISAADQDSQGLFGVTEGALIRNLELSSASVQGQGNVGLLVGLARNSQVYGSRVVNGQVAGDNSVGGLVGWAYNTVLDNRGSDWMIENHGGTVTAAGSRVGGLVGRMTGGQLYNANTDATTTVASTGMGQQDIGGLVGLAEQGAALQQVSGRATIETTNGQSDLGGVVGRLAGASVSDSHASASFQLSEQLTNLGGLVGTNENGTVQRSFLSGALELGAEAIHNVGGLVGNNAGGQVVRSYLAANVTAQGENVGGLVGRNAGEVVESYVQHAVRSHYDQNVNHAKGERNVILTAVDDSMNVGGLVGLNDGGSVTRSYVDMTIEAFGSNNVGGLVGANVSGGAISDSYALAIDSIEEGMPDANILGSGRFIAGRDSVGGLVGYNDAHVTHTYAAAWVQGDKYADHVGGLIGRAGNASDVVGSFWDLSVSDEIDSAGGQGRTSAQLRQRETYLDAGWNLSNVGGDGTTWRIFDDSNMYRDAYDPQTRPMLRTFLSTYVVGSGFSQEFNGTQFDWLSQQVGGTTRNNQLYNPVTHNQIFGAGVLGRIAGTEDDYHVRNAASYGLEFNGNFYSHQHGFDIVYNHDAVAQVTPRRLYVNVTPGAAQSKVYDGTNVAIVTAGSITRNTLGGGTFVSGDDVQVISQGVGWFSSPNAGNGLAVLTNGNSFQLSGADAGNYQVVGTNGSLTANITRRQMTLSADNQQKIYGEANPALTWQAEAMNGDRGFVTGDTLSGALGTTAWARSNVGQYDITQGTLGSPNYIIAFTGGKLDITPREVVVTANDLQRVYGEANPALSWQAESQHDQRGLLAGDSLSVSLETPAGQLSDVGSYGITRAHLGHGNGNYVITFEPGQLTITPRPVSVTAHAQNKVYGQLDPTLSYHVEGVSSGRGFLHGDGLSGGISREGGETVGAYVIGQGNLAASSNYALTFTEADLVITQRAISLSAELVSKYYGDADPKLSVTIVGGSLASDAVSDTLIDLVGELSREAGRNVGQYSILLGKGANANNYAITFDTDNKALTIVPRHITVAANDVSKYVGRPDPVLSWRVIDGKIVAGDRLQGGLAREAGHAAGNYVIGQGSMHNGNYAIRFIEGNLEILPDPVPLRTAQLVSRSLPNVLPNALSPSNVGLGNVAAQGNLQLVDVSGSGSNDTAMGNVAPGDSNTNGAEIPFVAVGGNVGGPLQVFVLEGGIKRPSESM